MWTTSMIALDSDLHDEAHCTIEYLGETDEIQASPEQIKEALQGLQTGTLEVKVFGAKVFGGDDPVIVAILDPTELTPLFEEVQSRLESIGVENKSSYKDEEYKPHVTLKPLSEFSGMEELRDLPETLTLGPLGLWWNEERIEI